MADPVFDVVRTVRAVREYGDREIPGDVLDRVVEAAHLSASAANMQPWHFVVVRDRDELRRLGALLSTGPYVANAAAAVIAAHEKKSPYGVSDVSRAVQSMMITAWADGVGSNWVGFGGLDGVAKAFGIPDTHDVLVVVPLGYPARSAGTGRKKRKPLEAVVSDGRFGTPYRLG